MRASASDKLDRLAMRVFGYDPNDPVPRGENGERIIPDRLLDDLVAAPLVSEESLGKRRQARTANNPLSRSELAVLACISHGESHKQIALRLGKSYHTVKEQTKRARQLLGVTTNTHACCEAIRRGLIN